MQIVTIDQIEDQLQKLPADKLVVVYDFVSYLLERMTTEPKSESPSEAWQTMLASESTLGQDWERPEEEAAWADL